MTIATSGPTLFFNNLAAGGGQTFTLDTTGYRNVSFYCKWTGLRGAALDASIKIQVTNMPNPTEDDWVDKSGATFPVATANGKDLISLVTATEASYRIVYACGQVTDGHITGYYMLKE